MEIDRGRQGMFPTKSSSHLKKLALSNKNAHKTLKTKIPSSSLVELVTITL